MSPDKLRFAVAYPNGEGIKSVRMSPIQTKSLLLVAQTREEVCAWVKRMEPHEKAELSPAWLAQLEVSSPVDPWIHGFVLLDQETGSVVGRCGFKGPPGADGIVEIAYGVAPEHEGKGYATEAAEALVRYALADGSVRVIRAHTLSDSNASSRVLTKCGFRRIGEVVDPDDGRVWRWEKP